MDQPLNDPKVSMLVEYRIVNFIVGGAVCANPLVARTGYQRSLNLNVASA